MPGFIDSAGIVVINLDQCADRLHSFRIRNAHLGPVRRFSAILGADADRAELKAAGVITGEIDYSDGALGCALSHFALWEEIARGTQAITICEDDAVFAQDFVATANARLAGLPDDWDVVLWDGILTAGWCSRFCPATRSA
jgi:GR25 family glycosyltransferase involved in LPS biosynthesis